LTSILVISRDGTEVEVHRTGPKEKAASSVPRVFPFPRDESSFIGKELPVPEITQQDPSCYWHRNTEGELWSALFHPSPSTVAMDHFLSVIGARDGLESLG
jgi:hypothetical protein